MYNIRCNSDLGVGKTAVRRIPYACNYCIEQLEFPQDKNEKDSNKKRYDVNKNYLYWNIFEALNNWNIITLVTTITNNTEKDDEAFGTILRGVETIMSKNINYNLQRNENS